MEKHADAFIALPGVCVCVSKKKKKNTINVFQLFSIFLSETFLESIFQSFRWLWNHGRVVRDDSMVSARNS